MITFGGYDVSKYAMKGLNSSDIFWANIMDEKYWTIPMTGAAYSKPPFSMVNHSDTEPALLSDIKARYAIMDTGVSYALIPTGDFLKIKESLE
jgi:hypothetical protein